jgi:hypothetical protein
MFPTDIKIGYILRYSYLWHRDHLAGREEGEKDRPCMVLAIAATTEAGDRIVRVLPITHAPPTAGDEAIEIPPAVKLRLGLDEDRSWIVLTESNRFVWPGPDLRPIDRDDGYYGAIPPRLFAIVRDRFVALARVGAHAAIGRSE